MIFLYRPDSIWKLRERTMENPGCLVPTPNPSFTTTFTYLPFLYSLFKFALTKTINMQSVELHYVVFMTQR